MRWIDVGGYVNHTAYGFYKDAIYGPCLWSKHLAWLHLNGGYCNENLSILNGWFLSTVLSYNLIRFDELDEICWGTSTSTLVAFYLLLNQSLVKCLN